MSEALAYSMDVPDLIHLDLEGRRYPVQIRRRSSERSPHSGRELAELHGWATTTDPETHRWLAGVLKESGDQALRALNSSGDPLGRWQVSWNSYGEAAGVHTYTLILKECEELNLEALLIGEQELHPYEYREEPTDGGLTIWAKMVGTEDDVRKLRRMLRSSAEVPVLRRGIEETPRSMRLGVGEWTEYEDRIKYRLVLVERGVDESSHPELARIRRDNNRAAVGFYMNFAERLVGLLTRKGLLTEAEVEAVREAAISDRVAVRHDFWRVVADVDDR